MSKPYTAVCVLVALLVVSYLYWAPGIKKASTKPVTSTAKILPNPIPELQMINIPAGEFLMGNSGTGDDGYFRTEEDRGEVPRHTVFLSAYSIGRCEVTRGEYRKFIKSGGYSTRSYWSKEGWKWKIATKRTKPDLWAVRQNFAPGYFNEAFNQTDRHPVVGVTFYEAEAFCTWAGGQLPTEAQWERAARWTGTHANVYPWGDLWDSEKCNSLYDHNKLGGLRGGHTTPVGSYPSGASPCGCQDMAGNVWEWCKDHLDPDYYSHSPKKDPEGPNGHEPWRVLRGGTWWGGGDDFDFINRCAYRNESREDTANCTIGFRLVRQ